MGFLSLAKNICGVVSKVTGAVSKIDNPMMVGHYLVMDTSMITKGIDNQDKATLSPAATKFEKKINDYNIVLNSLHSTQEMFESMVKEFEEKDVEGQIARILLDDNEDGKSKNETRVRDTVKHIQANKFKMAEGLMTIIRNDLVAIDNVFKTEVNLSPKEKNKDRNDDVDTMKRIGVVGKMVVNSSIMSIYHNTHLLSDSIKDLTVCQPVHMSERNYNSLQEFCLPRLMNTPRNDSDTMRVFDNEYRLKPNKPGAVSELNWETLTAMKEEWEDRKYDYYDYLYTKHIIKEKHQPKNGDKVSSSRTYTDTPPDGTGDDEGEGEF